LAQKYYENCNASNVQISYVNSKVTSTSTCPEDYSFDEVWTAVDENGNPTSKTVMVAVQVTSDITWSFQPSNIVQNCNLDFSTDATGLAVAIDQCSRIVNVTSTDSNNITCKLTSYQFTRTFYTERCNISTTYNQTFTVLPLPVPQPPPLPSPVPQPSIPSVSLPEPLPVSIPVSIMCSCTNGFCKEGNSTCSSCMNGFFGPNCETCFCQNGACSDGITGTGLCQTCISGWYGINCDTTCTCQNGTCNDGPSGDGTCLQCYKSYYGLNCQNQCTCSPCDDGPFGSGACLKTPSSPAPSGTTTSNPIPDDQNSGFTLPLVTTIALLVIGLVLFAILLLGVICYLRLKEDKFRLSSGDKVPLVEMHERN